MRTMLAYICSQYTDKNPKIIEENIKKAEQISQKTYEQMENTIPICVHTFLNKTTGLSEETGHRQKLLEKGTEILMKCEIIIINTEKKLSEGMKKEITAARKKGLLELYYQNEQITFVNYNHEIEKEIDEL